VVVVQVDHLVVTMKLLLVDKVVVTVLKRYMKKMVILLQVLLLIRYVQLVLHNVHAVVIVVWQQDKVVLHG
jgi:hypothetical protein